MGEQLFIEGKEYVSSKKAAEESGYAQDYVGQLARKGLISARRVGNSWYILPESLAEYQKNAALFAPQAPKAVVPRNDPEVSLSFDGKSFISGARAAKVTGYNQDYIGQLARSGRVLSRQVGNRWYIDAAGIAAHKQEKDALLAKIQRDAVGLTFPTTERPINDTKPFFTYQMDEKPLLPCIQGISRRAEEAVTDEKTSTLLQRTPIPIHVISEGMGPHVARKQSHRPVGISVTRKTRPYRATPRSLTYALATLTIMLLVGYSFSSFRDRGLFVSLDAPLQKAAVSEVYGTLIVFLENLLIPEIDFVRN